MPEKIQDGGHGLWKSSQRIKMSREKDLLTDMLRILQQYFRKNEVQH
jgi:hypothetical protein